MRRWLLTPLVASLFMVACSAPEPTQATTEERYPPTTINHAPIEVHLSGQGDTYQVSSQCDGHGHRIFASRHPERFQVVNDPTCPGGPER